MKNLMIIQENSNRNEYFTVEDYMFNNRELVLDDDVNPHTMTSLINQVRYLDKISPGEEITLYINSPGGEVTSGLVLYDVLRLVKSPIRTVCIGTAASMGAILFLAGDKRCMTIHSQIMIHDPAVRMGNAPSKALSVQETLDSLMKTREELARIIADRTHKPIRSIYAKTKGDAYFNAKEALEFGLATEIVDEI
ncbi:MAG: ATP-dependent Clp protease proteolytic subunit [Lachnospiraceae bacterium]|nr:ATP-dependent Clp protease proteolytic subunit [Lachnospiraceae bacterium]